MNFHVVDPKSQLSDRYSVDPILLPVAIPPPAAISTP